MVGLFVAIHTKMPTFFYFKKEENQMSIKQQKALKALFKLLFFSWNFWCPSETWTGQNKLHYPTCTYNGVIIPLSYKNEQRKTYIRLYLLLCHLSRVVANLKICTSNTKSTLSIPLRAWLHNVPPLWELQMCQVFALKEPCWQNSATQAEPLSHRGSESAAPQWEGTWGEMCSCPTQDLRAGVLMLLVQCSLPV